MDNIDKHDANAIALIAGRAQTMGQEKGTPYEALNAAMDLVMLHICTPLDLLGLLHAGEYDFFHDVFGIRGNLDRGTGELPDYFTPHFARSNDPEQEDRTEMTVLMNWRDLAAIRGAMNDLIDVCALTMEGAVWERFNAARDKLSYILDAHPTTEIEEE